MFIAKKQHDAAQHPFFSRLPAVLAADGYSFANPSGRTLAWSHDAHSKMNIFICESVRL
ncbi:hypothetical protein CV_0525 [Chromobacterium violaceum ATCC 12472]|uniref:Uncharacterized protein n=1 Tax=Chromobacterium violaceum (strain ATCC 12472 / DSM 30191 / JCM 1249 / CCUG 213 / NBRC 12614 / NCIMB 9131 / NCTC 9757 / MK) TaxID=243365 RepID=Q7P0P1_CHRVO|nr:hypothetical protein CV_0525 [Chromobacterium violaceum ATCC 12472]